jgi:hypothetical protein
MPIQECALYGDLVLYLRDRAAEMLAEAKANSSFDEAHQRLDALIRDWFFTSRDDLYGSAPRDVIWREQLGEGNPIPPEYARQTFDDDCPICQSAIEEIEAGEHDHSHGGGWQWTYCPDVSLIDIYDPEGSEERWQKERLCYQPQLDQDTTPTGLPTYAPPAVEDLEVSPEEFMERLNQQSWVDDRLQRVANRLVDRLDCPVPAGFFGPDYRRLSQGECLSLVRGLDEQGVSLDELVKQVEAWPYQNVALDWLSEPERHTYFIIRAMETRLDPADKAELIRFRQHRDFLFILCQLVPYNARLWLGGWLEGRGVGNPGQGGGEDRG